MTPRNTVFVGAVARTVFVFVAVLYEYSLVGEVTYSINTPHASGRPAMEMIIVPDSINMAALGACRVHDVPDPVYCAMLFTVSDAVSVIQMEPVEAQTNPYGLYAYATALVTVLVTPPPPEEMGGAVVNTFSPPAGMGDADESVYISTLL